MPPVVPTVRNVVADPAIVGSWVDGSTVAVVRPLTSSKTLEA